MPFLSLSMSFLRNQESILRSVIPVQMGIHVPQFCRGTMNCALPFLLSFVYPGHDASCPYICHFCKTCPRSPIRSRTGSDRGTGINRHSVIPTKVGIYAHSVIPAKSGIHLHSNYPTSLCIYYISLFLFLQLSGCLPEPIAKLEENILKLYPAFLFFDTPYL